MRASIGVVRSDKRARNFPVCPLYFFVGKCRQTLFDFQNFVDDRLNAFAFTFVSRAKNLIEKFHICCTILD